MGVFLDSKVLIIRGERDISKVISEDTRERKIGSNMEPCSFSEARKEKQVKKMRNVEEP